ncbi:MAG: class II glutamine amidotransferase [Fervidobacterium sp.]
MCRMAGFSSKSGINLIHIIEPVKHMAKYGLEAPHNDGWGMIGLSETYKLQYQSINPIYEDLLILDLNNIISTAAYKLGIVHARLASEGLPKTTLQLHPFYINGKYFAHNGTIKSALKNNVYSSDTFEYFESISSFGSLGELSELIRFYSQKHTFSGMNFLMVDELDRALYVCCLYAPSDKNEKYYTLYYKKSNGTFFVFSEKIIQESFPMKNGELFKVIDGEIVEKTNIFIAI